MKRRTNAINRHRLVGPLENMDDAKRKSWEACVKAAAHDCNVRFIVECAKATQDAYDKYNRGEITAADVLKVISVSVAGRAVAGDILKEEGLL